MTRSRGRALLLFTAWLTGCAEDEAPQGTPAACREFVMPADCTVPPNAVLPADLRCTGLYGNWENREIACGVEPYEPAHALWSDGAGKARYVSLPEGAAVDESDPDAFQFPVGTSFWKAFSLPSGDLAETRLLRKSEAGWVYTTYVWDEGQTTAVQNNDGVPDLYGTGHTVPARAQCKECHAGRPDYVLGWDAFLLGDLAVPGDDIERDALGYLHVNCGVSCHNDTAAALGRESGLYLHLDAESASSALTSPAFLTGNGRVPSPNAPILDLPVPASGPFVDLAPRDTERSLILARMKVRGVPAQMPRVATNVADQAGIASVEAWIMAMTPERGYP